MALREINLIPNEILAQRHLLRHLFFWAGCLIISLSLIFGSYLYKTHVVLAKKRSLTSLKDTHSQLGARIEEIKRIKEEIERLAQKQSVLETVTRTQAYSQVLLKLADIMNENTWLTQLDIDGSKDANHDASLKLTGFSLYNEELGNFLSQLSAEPLFKAVLLKYAKETNILNQNPGESVKLIQFQIECNISRG